MAVKEDNSPQITEYETVQERGLYNANGHTFTVEPVYFGEETEYFFDVPLSLHLQESGSKISDEDLAEYIIALFQVKNDDATRQAPGLLGKVKLWLAKLTKRYGYYSDNPGAIGMVKWLERKVKYKGRNIKFYDLERKYKLTKLEIAKLYRYMEVMSGF